MANIDKEIAAVKARLDALRKKEREQAAKQRARFGDALIDVIDSLDDPSSVSVRTLIDRAQALIDEQNAKRKQAAAKAAARRRAKAEASRSTNPYGGE